MFKLRQLLSVIFFSLVVTGFFWLGFSLKNITSGLLLSEPVELKICVNFSSENDLQVFRITRAEAEFALTAKDSGDCRIYQSREWFQGVKLVINDKLLPTVKEINLKLGSQEWNFLPKDLASITLTNKDQNITEFFIDSSFSQSTVSHLARFSGIINWPGDFNLLLRSFLISLKALFFIFIFTLLLASAAVFWNNKNKQLKKNIEEIELARNSKLYIYVFSFLLSIISLVIFIKGGPTAYDWPTMDMGPFFSRYFDHSFAINDFFTNSSSQPNPRFIFGYLIIGLTKILHSDWYSVLFYLKTFLIVVFPPLIFVVLYKFLETKVAKGRPRLLLSSLLFLGVLLLLFPKITNYFCIALWPAFQITPSAEYLSLLFGFLACEAYYFDDKRIYWLGILSWLVAVLLHPAKGFCLFIFFLLFNFHFNNWKKYLPIILGGVVLPMLLLLVFPASQPLSAKDFVQNYINENHAFHYLPSNFIGFTSIPWALIFLTVNFILIFFVFLGYFTKNKFLIRLSGLFWLTYAGSVVLEYLFVEKWPMKMVATIGPVRYTFLGFWMLFILGAYVIVHYQSSKIILPIFSTKKINLKYLLVALLLFFSLAIVISGGYLKDDHFLTVKNEDRGLGEWLNNQTFSTDIFASDIFDLNVNLPLVYNRAVLVGNGFPFREDSFVEYNRRKNLLFGSYEQWSKMPGGEWLDIKMKNYFRSLSSKDFIEISKLYKLDYVIIEKDFYQNFLVETPVFENSQYKIYQVANLK